MTNAAEASLTEWTEIHRDRDNRVRNAYAAGVTKNRIHTITRISRATIDRILDREPAMHDADNQTVTTSVLNPATQVWEVVEREPAKGIDLDAVELVAEDFGGIVGATYRIEVRDSEDTVLRSVDITAR